MYLGIDLGTTNSVLYRIEGKDILPVESRDGGYLVPSYVYVSEEDGKLVYNVGKLAKNMAKIEPENVISSYKTFIEKGSNKDDESAGKVYKVIQGKKFTPIMCSALNLKYMKDNAEKVTASKVDGAVITVPAYFAESQKAATKEAAKLAGFKNVVLLEEPTAAAFAYGVIQNQEKDIMVFDLGGGTFDISILTVSPDADGLPKVDVVGLAGDNHLGGDNIDRALADYIISKNKLKLNENEISKLKAHCEDLKIAISTAITNGEKNPTSTIKVTLGTGKKKTVEFTLDEEIYRLVATPVINRAIEAVFPALARAGAEIDDISEIVLVGGSTRNPIVRERLEEITKGRFNRKYFDKFKIDPDMSVAYGAAIYQKLLLAKKEANSPMIPKPIGIELEDGEFEVLVHENTPIPIKERRMFTNGSEATQIRVSIFEGFSKKCVNNDKLGELVIEVPPAPKGTHSVEITLNVTKDGTLKAQAKVNLVKRDIPIEREFKIEAADFEGLFSDITGTTIDNPKESKSDKHTDGKSADTEKTSKSKSGKKSSKEDKLNFDNGN